MSSCDIWDQSNFSTLITRIIINSAAEYDLKVKVASAGPNLIKFEPFGTSKHMTSGNYVPTPDHFIGVWFYLRVDVKKLLENLLSESPYSQFVNNIDSFNWRLTATEEVVRLLDEMCAQWFEYAFTSMGMAELQLRGNPDSQLSNLRVDYDLVSFWEWPDIENFSLA